MKQSKNRYISFLLALVMILTIFPMNVFAGNNDTLPSNPSTGKASSDWKYAKDWEGVRISLYWAPSEQDFINGTELVRQLGKTRDFTKTGPRYKIDEYTTYSIYRYMNGDNEGKGEKYNSELDKFNKYYYIGKEDSNIVANMPPVWNGKKVDWDNWIEGNNYKNIEEISRLLGQKVTAEDFIRGNLNVEGYKAKGLYKIFKAKNKRDYAITNSRDGSFCLMLEVCNLRRE